MNWRIDGYEPLFTLLTYIFSRVISYEIFVITTTFILIFLFYIYLTKNGLNNILTCYIILSNYYLLVLSIGILRFKVAIIIFLVYLITNNKVACIIDENAYRYLGYVDENETPAVGYVLELFKGEKLSFYERNEKVYMGATQARTSLERSFPARFVDKKKFYFSIENGSLKEVKLNKKKVINSLKAYDKDVKIYISTSKTKLKSKEDVLQLLSFIEKN